MTQQIALDPEALPEDPGPRLSVVRVVAAVLVMVLLAVAGVVVHRHQTQDHAITAARRAHPAWFAPYVDVTLTPSSAFQSKAANPARRSVLGFVVAGTGTEDCTPTWGTYATLTQAAATYDLDRRITQYRGEGGDVTISFGGAANTELAAACTSDDDLLTAYRQVIDHYHAKSVDFDIEGAALADTAATTRRARVLHRLQQQEARAGHPFTIWLTLPVAPQGMQPDAVSLVRTTLSSGLTLAGVNVMAMDFGGSTQGMSMGAAITAAMTASEQQVEALYAAAGAPPSPAQRWSHLGVTIMIGQNDDGGNVSVAAARAFAAAARQHGVGRVSMWSLNRDAACGSTFAVVGTHSNYCSGARQSALAFSKAFTTATTHVPTSAPASQSKALGPLAGAAPDAADDPARSPYPVWQPAYPYPTGYEVVWHRAVYAAKWYTRGQMPDAEASSQAPSAWRLVGPVLASDRAPALPRVAPGTYPDWTVQGAYRAGDRVLQDGLPYQAKYYTSGDEPAGALSDPEGSPWRALLTIPGEPTTAP